MLAIEMNTIDAGQQRQPRGEAAQVVELPRVVAVVNHADEQEQRRRSTGRD